MTYIILIVYYLSYLSINLFGHGLELKRVVSISLVFLTLALSVNVKLAYHYCGGKVAQVKIVVGYGEATCGMEKDVKECTSHKNKQISAVPCCSDELEEITTDNFNFFLKQIKDLSTSITDDYFQISYTIFRGTNIIHFLEYRPPPLISSVSLSEIRVFLI